MSDSSPIHVILFCHGSSDPLWAKPFRELTKSLQTTYGEDQVHLGFLERSEPDLSTLAAQIAENGPAHIKLLPVFLSAGKHLREDLPPMTENLAKQYQGLTFEILPPVGQQEAFKTMLAQLVGEHLGT